MILDYRHYLIKVANLLIPNEKPFQKRTKNELKFYMIKTLMGGSLSDAEVVQLVGMILILMGTVDTELIHFASEKCFISMV